MLELYLKSMVKILFLKNIKYYKPVWLIKSVYLKQSLY